MNDNHTVQLEGLLSMTKKKVEYFQETCDKLKEKMQKSLIATQLKQSYSQEEMQSSENTRQSLDDTPIGDTCLRKFAKIKHIVIRQQI